MIILDWKYIVHQQLKKGARSVYGYILTRKEADFLEQIILTAKKDLDDATKDRAEAGAGQDTWHDENFKNGIAEEAQKYKIWKDWDDMRTKAQIIIPEEQDSVIDIGSGAIIFYPDGSQIGIVFVGYNLPGMYDMEKRIGVSAQSPLGIAIRGAKKGEERKMNDTKLKIEKIFRPSESEKAFEVNI